MEHALFRQAAGKINRWGNHPVAVIGGGEICMIEVSVLHADDMTRLKTLKQKSGD